MQTTILVIAKRRSRPQISYSANLYGLAEEEHAGGALAFPSYDLGERFHADERLTKNGLTFKEMAVLYKDMDGCSA
ncbi:MAG: hypothetical protein AB2L24_32040 [Mangrovibacterium sp.]